MNDEMTLDDSTEAPELVQVTVGEWEHKSDVVDRAWKVITRQEEAYTALYTLRDTYEYMSREWQIYEEMKNTVREECKTFRGLVGL